MELVAHSLTRLMLDRDPTEAEVERFNRLSPDEISARISKLTELLSVQQTKQIGSGVPFTKAWLLKLQSGPAPEKMVEYQDSHTDAPSEGGTNFLRARHFPSGGVKLSVLRTPRGSRQAVRVTLKDHPVDENLKLPKARTDAAAIALALLTGNPNTKAAVPTGPLTLQMAWDSFLLSGPKLATGTLDNMKRNITVHLSKYLKTELKELVSVEAIQKIRQTAVKSCLKRPNAKDGETGANNVMRSLRRMVRYTRAVQDDAGIPEWPGDKLKHAGGIWTKERKRKSRLHPHQFPDYWPVLMEQPEAERDYHHLLFLCGCRKSEMLELTWKNIDFNGKTFTFPDPKNHMDHTLPMTPTILAIFERRLAAAKLTKNSLPPTRLFRMDPRTTTDRIIKQCGIKITPHDIRRTFAGIADRTNATRGQIAVLLNQLSGTVTDDYIGDMDREQKLQIMQAIEARMMVCVETGQ